MISTYRGAKIISAVAGVLFLLYGISMLVFRYPIDLSVETKYTDLVDKRAYVKAENYTIVSQKGDAELVWKSTYGGRYSEDMDGYLILVNSSDGHSYELEIAVQPGKLDAGVVDLYGKFIQVEQQAGAVLFTDTNQTILEYFVSVGFYFVLSACCWITMLKLKHKDSSGWVKWGGHYGI